MLSWLGAHRTDAGSFSEKVLHDGRPAAVAPLAWTASLVAIARQHTLPTVMLGDFNDWFWPGSLRDALRHELPGRTRQATFPSWCPVLRLDRIFCWPPEILLNSFVDRSARRASDHLPVIADIAVD